MTSPPIPTFSFQPVFILGPHRSGCGPLYRALAGTGAFNLVTAYHVLHRDSLLEWHVNGREAEARAALAARLAALDVRDGEAPPVGPDLPEDYAHALSYQRPLPRFSRRNFPGFLRFCNTLQLLQGAERPLLLKNPFDSRRFVDIKRALPHARFVFLHRSPVDVINSQVRMIRALLAERHDYHALVVEWYRSVWQSRWRLAIARTLYARSRLLVHHVRWNLVRLCRFLVRNVDRVSEDAIHVRYSDLCARPDEVVGALLEFCPARPRTPLTSATLLRSRASVIDPYVSRYEAAINRQTAQYRQRFGV
jgi:hypothetical protein